ncbi:MAG: leucine--tRNA ligase [Bacteroidetes bacterium]|nr:leucine--tRNA ligase [Bacteroidota bacterium]
MEYHFKEIEQKWQARWAKDKTFRAENNSAKPKYYVLDMFPYPSGAGLHVGHPLGYIASDIMARYKRHKGFNVLHPMGYDSFGLPAEQYAIQTGQHPAVTTEQNIKRYREQLDKIGFSFDWDREVRTSDPKYYKWTQWIFIQLFNSWYNPRNNKAEPISTLIAVFETEGFKGSDHNILTGDIEKDLVPFTATDWKSFDAKKRSDILMHFRLAYLGEAYVNWCPALGTVLANDEVKDGVSERGGHPVERKLMKQWSMRITTYAQRLLDGLDDIDWTDSLKEAQRNWIGRSEGASLEFGLIPGPSPKEKGVDKPRWQTADPAIYDILKKYARENRRPQTEAEDLVWQQVRNNKLGFKFRRQHAVGTYIADFICLEKGLIVEIDGEIHELTKERDENRTAVLEQLGFKVIRFTNAEVKQNINDVIARIREVCNSTPSQMERGQGGEAKITVFTTRPDTVFGVSFVTLAPEHELVDVITTAEQKQAVNDYVTKAKNRSERERQADVNTISGVFTGAFVEHPFTGKPVPVWIGDYVLAGYGTGAVMAVPAHDERDYKFAKHFNLPLPQVIEPTSAEHDFAKDAWGEKEGKLINSDFLNGLDVKAAIKKAIAEIEARGLGKGKVNYRLRDAVFGRQRYWGEPIPVYYKDGIPQVLADHELPLVLPEVDKFLPTEDGEPPLARAKDWKYKGQYDYEWTTMPGWAGSSWYFLRYMDAQNENAFADKKLADYWQNVDLYIGGSEHATGHLLYVRFWTKALKDLGFIGVDEPAKKLINQGMIQGTSEKVFMVTGSKSQIAIEYFRNKVLFTHQGLYHKSVRNIFISSEIVLSEKLEDGGEFVNVPIEFVNNNIVDIEQFKLRLVQNGLFENSIIVTKQGYFYNGEYLFLDGNTELLFRSRSEVEKMSKSKWNVQTPDEICEKFGADTLRLYEMFLGPLEQSKPWNTNGITGVAGFLKKLWRLFYAGGEFNVNDAEPTKSELKTLHKTIKKITDDIERFSFNTSVSNFMICVNELMEQKCNKRVILEQLLVLVSPYAPHIAEELWEKLGHKESISTAAFPVFNEAYLVEDSFSYPVSFNGKVRFNIDLATTLSPQEVEKLVLEAEQTQKYLEGKAPKKVIVVPKRIVNVVV